LFLTETYYYELWNHSEEDQNDKQESIEANLRIFMKEILIEICVE